MRPFLLASCVLVALLGSTGFARADEPGIVTFGADGAGEGLQASYAKGLTLDAAGNIYVLDPDPYNRVLKFSPALQYLTSWGSQGVGDGQFEMPRGVAIDLAGNVKVGEANGSRIQTFAPTGGFIASSAISQSTGDIAIDSGGNIYYGGFGGVITKFDSTGTWLKDFNDSGYISGLGIDPATGYIYAANSESHHIRVLDSELVPVQTFGSLGIGAGQFDQPGDVVVAGDDVYVSESGTPRLQRFSLQGVYRGVLGGDHVGQPGSLAADSQGRIYVTQYGTMSRIDPGLPVASLATAASVVAGDEATVDASASYVPFGTPDDFSWDLDGDGSFERSTGLSQSVTTHFAAPGQHNVRVRVTSAGRSTRAEAVVNVVERPTVAEPTGETPGTATPGPVDSAAPGPPSPTPPAGSVGVSINGGALFTNTPAVTVRIVWPAGTRRALLTNDGGFSAAKAFDVAASMPWELASTGSERLPKTLYVRFDSAGTQTFTDDIVLDQTKPLIRSARLETKDSRASAPRARTKRVYRVRLRARDKTSGVARVQLTARKRKPGARIRYASKLLVKRADRPRYARVQDRAGNWSRWKTLSHR